MLGYWQLRVDQPLKDMTSKSRFIIFDINKYWTMDIGFDILETVFFFANLFVRMIATNYIGPFSLTKLLLPLLKNSSVPSRVVNVTSFTHRYGEIYCQK